MLTLEPRRSSGDRHWSRVLAAMLFALLCACAVPGEVPRSPMDEVDSGANPRLFGAFTYGGVWHGMGPVERLERLLGRRLDVVHWFTDWDDPFDPAMVAAVSQGGRVPLISWEPRGASLASIASGAHDAHVRSWARGVAAHAGLVYLRPFPEMNGDWTPWNGEPATLRRAWRRIAGIFAEEGAANVRWVFGPNVTDEPRTEANRLEHYYPGDDVVDVLALSGYNWGETRPRIGWRSFEDVFAQAYARLAGVGPQPIWIAEVASSEAGGDKAAWVRDMFGSSAFSRLEAIVWFDEDKEADWRIDSSPEVAEAFREALSSREEPLAARSR